jgi:aryl sulfotransferase
MTDVAAWPRKTRELQNHHMDSTAWNCFLFRDGDIVIDTYAKSGTTWTQQIVGQLLSAGDPDFQPMNFAPWLDMRLSIPEKLATLEAQTGRRVIKSHLPLDALVFSPQAKYLYIGRHGRDVLWSFYNHHCHHTPEFYDKINNTPGRVGPPLEPPIDDVRQYWREWLRRDGYPYWSFWENVRTWWAARDLPNVLLVHFADLKRDLPGEIGRIAAFLDIPIDAARWDAIVEHCTFEWMKANGSRIMPRLAQNFEGGASTFINRGVNGRWAEILMPEDIAEYEARVVQALGSECAHWLATGELTSRAVAPIPE